MHLYYVYLCMINNMEQCVYVCHKYKEFPLKDLNTSNYDSFKLYVQ